MFLDINLGGILELIEKNVKRNVHLIQKNMTVMELDFKQLQWTPELTTAINETDIILAADGKYTFLILLILRSFYKHFVLVIYDDDLTDAFVRTLEKLLDPTPNNKRKIIYIALEKRYVFTVADLESLAPCYEYFLSGIEKLRYRKNWKFESIPIDFPQYFLYERVKELVLLKLSL